MMDIIGKIISGDNLKWLLLAVIIINAALSGLAQGLEIIGKSDKLPKWVASAAAVLKKIVDFLSANIPHK